MLPVAATMSFMLRNQGYAVRFHSLLSSKSFFIIWLLAWKWESQLLAVKFGVLKHFMNGDSVEESQFESGDRWFTGPTSWSQKLPCFVI